jgi:ADP-dependent NAD(P)H-hydrate dehydratase
MSTPNSSSAPDGTAADDDATADDATTDDATTNDATTAGVTAGPVTITPDLLRSWPLPEPGNSKYGRGQLIVVGGAVRSPGAAVLAGLAALRVGAGRLTLAVAETVAPHVGVALPESGVVPLAETVDGHVLGAGLREATDDLSAADAVLVGPGLDDAEEAETMLRLLPGLVTDDAVVVLDAFALGVAVNVEELKELSGRLVLTPNTSEAERLLGEEPGEDDNATALEIAERYGAVVTYQSVVAAPDGRSWIVGTGSGGLGTSGSGDVLAGAIAGLCARGADAAQASVWAAHAHHSAGDRLAVRVGPLGYLARELLDELPRVLVEVGA